MSLAKYWEAGKIGFFNSFVYTFDFFMGAFFIAIILFIFIQLWQTIYAGSNLIEGFTLSMMIWYLVMTETIVTSPGKLVEDIGAEIQSGSVAQNLNKPYNYLIFKYASSFGKIVLRMVITFVFGGVVTFLFVRTLPSVSLVHIPFLLISVFLAVTIHFCLMALMGIFSFWLEDARSLDFVYSKFVFVLGGMLVPLEIFPSWLETISKYLPFSYIAYYPAKLFVSFNWKLALEVIALQIGWILVLVVIVALIYKMCIKRININGG